jgi:hypothetical protein
LCNFVTDRLDVHHLLLLGPLLLLLLLGAAQSRHCTAALHAAAQQHVRRIHSSLSHSEPLVDLRTPQHRHQEPATLRRPRRTLEQQMRQIFRPFAIAEGTPSLPLCVRIPGLRQTAVGVEHADAHFLNLSHLRRPEIAHIGPKQLASLARRGAQIVATPTRTV